MAPRTKASNNPALITWARETAGFSVAEAAARLNVSEEQLLAWEDVGSDDSPSIPQLRKIAALFKRPLAAFFLAEAPSGFAVMRDLRRLPGTGIRHFSPALQMEIRASNERRELALELASDLEEEPTQFELSAKVTDDPETVGAKIRIALGVTDDLQAKWKDADGRAAFTAWRTRIEEAGVLVFQSTTFASEEASGFAISSGTLPVIAVNRKDPLTRRTFSLLHEFAHLMVRISSVSELETDVTRPPEDQRVEVFCNHVAAAALIPKENLLAQPTVVAHGTRSVAWKDGELADLARLYGASREALLRRLLTFGRTTPEFYSLKRAQYNAEYALLKKRQKETATEMKRNMPQETISTIGRPLVRMLLGNYYQDRLSLSALSGFLNLKVKHIPKLEQAVGMR
ncbi:XRE family transcriptional regulator [Bradyrhizobium pachyrhizi]|uniref:XRE family transcriptional regulator n=1 Tax=Bradyrhizobium pachyrhizi TaxID=280333 RepID=UPI0024B1B2E6|nr:XRE family transcriptional regulator [Bradyrhizobium pachyrhizi]WFU55504.1 XRE family transcriptional regulator [Bradyrhizobium pachyrhizi]